MNIYVGNVKYEMTENDLKEMFSAYGEVASARIITDKDTGRSKGFGFVEMPDRAEGTDAMESMNGISLGKKPLVVKEAEERPSSAGSGFPRTGGGAPRTDRGDFRNERPRRY